MNIDDFLSKQDEVFLKKCFDELEDFRKTGVLIDGEVRKLNATFFKSNVSTLFSIGELIYREIAKRHFN